MEDRRLACPPRTQCVKSTVSDGRVSLGVISRLSSRFVVAGEVSSPRISQPEFVEG